MAFSSKNICIEHIAYPKLHILFYFAELPQEDPLESQFRCDAKTFGSSLGT